MKAEYKAKWVAALRSGDYEQGRGQLNRDGKFCCLGVLSDIVKDELNAVWVEWGNGYAYHAPAVSEQEAAVLPISVINLVGMPNPSGTLPSGYRARYDVRQLSIGLTALNDDEGLTFDQIADVVDYFF